LTATLSNLNRFQQFLQRQNRKKMYETGRACTYLLLKENDANDVINVSLFATTRALYIRPGYTAVEPGRNTGGKCRLYCNRTAAVLHGRIIRP